MTEQQTKRILTDFALSWGYRYFPTKNSEFLLLMNCIHENELQFIFMCWKVYKKHLSFVFRNVLKNKYCLSKAHERRIMSACAPFACVRYGRDLICESL